MYLVLSVFLAMDVIIMTAWSLINPFYPEIEYFPRETSDVTDKDIEFLPQLQHCRSQNLFVWYGTCILLPCFDLQQSVDGPHCCYSEYTKH